MGLLHENSKNEKKEILRKRTTTCTVEGKLKQKGRKKKESQRKEKENLEHCKINKM